MADPELFDELEEDLGAYADAEQLAARDRADAGKDPRGPGRPKGATNRKTQDFERWYQAKGWTDPLAAMARFLTADPVALQAWFIEHERTKTTLGKAKALAAPNLLEIIKEQHAVASQLAPYLHGKKPVEIAIIDERLPSLIIDLGTNQLEEGRMIAGRRALSVGDPLEIEASEINDLDDDEPERLTRDRLTKEPSP